MIATGSRSPTTLFTTELHIQSASISEIHPTKIAIVPAQPDESNSFCCPPIQQAIQQASSEVPINIKLPSIITTGAVWDIARLIGL